MILKAFKVDDKKIVDSGSSRTNKTIRNLSKNNKSRNLIYMPNIEATREPIFLTFDAKKTFDHLWLAFINTPILENFDLKSYIQIKTDTSSYIIDGILS